LPEVLKTPAVNVYIPEVVEKKNVSTAGSVSLKGKPDYEIIDRDLIPDEYWIVDEKLIAQQVRANVKNIPGVRIFTVMGVGRVTLKK
jgi:hypothetical protein